jgi:subtilisin family serine protease
MQALDLVNLTPLMARTSGRADIKIGLIDGPVAMGHPDLASGNIVEIPGKLPVSCASKTNLACTHGTFVAGILAAKRGSAAPAICSGCTLLVRPIFPEPKSAEEMPNANPEELASAITDVINAGARLISLSIAVGHASMQSESELTGALNYAASRSVLVAVAAGNQGALQGSVVTSHQWAIPVAACDLYGGPLAESNLGVSIGRRGLMAPGSGITSLVGGGGTQVSRGTSAAVPFVAGALALLWSEFPRASAAEVKTAIMQTAAARRKSITPPLLNAWAAYKYMLAQDGAR